MRSDWKVGQRVRVVRYSMGAAPGTGVIEQIDNYDTTLLVRFDYPRHKPTLWVDWKDTALFEATAVLNLLNLYQFGTDETEDLG